MGGVSAVVVIVVIPAAVHVQQSQVIYRKDRMQQSAYKYLHVLVLAHNLNSTSLTANWKLLLNLYINIFFELKLVLVLTFLRPAGSPPGGTEVTPTYGVPVVGASQISKSSDTA